jgi:hypothetical protein
VKEPLGPAVVAIIAVISVAGPAWAADWSARGQTDAGTRSLPRKAFAATDRARHPRCGPLVAEGAGKSYSRIFWPERAVESNTATPSAPETAASPSRVKDLPRSLTVAAAIPR